jgi:hypothetical protein
MNGNLTKGGVPWMGIVDKNNFLKSKGELVKGYIFQWIRATWIVCNGETNGQIFVSQSNKRPLGSSHLPNYLKGAQWKT